MDKIDLFSNHQDLHHPKAHQLARIENPLCNEEYLIFPSSIKTRKVFNVNDGYNLVEIVKNSYIIICFMENKRFKMNIKSQ